MDKEKMDKKISVYGKSFRSYFMDFEFPTVKPRVLISSIPLFSGGVGYSLPQSTNPKFAFREKPWTFGIVTSLETLDPVETKLNLNSDGTGKLVSILPSRNRRIIIHSIEVKLNNAAWYNHQSFIKFSLLKVKKKIHNSNVGQSNNLSNSSFIGSEQLVEKGCFFSENVKLRDLNYDMSPEDDLILIEKIEVERSGGGLHTSTSGPVVYYAGIGNTFFSSYDCVVHYSLGEIV